MEIILICISVAITIDMVHSIVTGQRCNPPMGGGGGMQLVEYNSNMRI